ncbi:remorin family protein [Arabidopsis lyrata subsp. lyrata]|uniref:Remorin family protein n=1 Tax=Arabidopsis lyrata subsp. lyrata TaxID=81972 RepID=D7KET1_ARALL|nr:remorin family protein [Arabidopsis lyrata subsp. lyrata]
MDYERIEKVQKSIISPTKLRMKLMGPLNNMKREGSKSNSNSSRTSPSRLQISDDSEFSKNCLLASKSFSDDDVAASTTDKEVAKLPNEPVLDITESDNQASIHRCEGVQQFRKGDLNMAPPHIMRPQEDENLDYDSNASSSSFEFHRARGERSNQNHGSRGYPSRQMPSKWNDAEKWIMSRQNMVMRKNGQGNRMPVRVVPDNAGYEHNKSRMDLCQSSQVDGLEKFPNFVPSAPHPILTQEYGGDSLIDQSTQSNDLVVPSHDNSTGGHAIRSVCMRDMGTEMTPIPSQEPSRSVTPVGATTPLRSPTSSLPSTPRGGQQEESSLSQNQPKNTRRELSEEEEKAKTRREIVALGVQLGKMNIAAWASKEEGENNNNNGDAEEAQKIEFEKRATAWEEAEKSKHNARYKREEIRIQAWESQEKAKLEAEMRRIEVCEAKVEQMKAEAEAKIVKKIAMAKQRSEEKRALAEARKTRDAEKAVAEAQYIRETGRIPASSYKICCGWFS